MSGLFLKTKKCLDELVTKTLRDYIPRQVAKAFEASFVYSPYVPLVYNNPTVFNESGSYIAGEFEERGFREMGSKKVYPVFDSGENVFVRSKSIMSRYADKKINYEYYRNLEVYPEISSALDIYIDEIEDL